jgi:hypothetical protein
LLLMWLLSGLVRHNTVAKWRRIHFLGLDSMDFDFTFLKDAYVHVARMGGG